MSDYELRLFQSIGLSEGKAKETAKNATLSKTLAWIISEVDFDHVIPFKCIVDGRLIHYVVKMSVNKLGTCYII